MTESGVIEKTATLKLNLFIIFVVYAATITVFQLIGLLINFNLDLGKNIGVIITFIGFLFFFISINLRRMIIKKYNRYKANVVLVFGISLLTGGILATALFIRQVQTGNIIDTSISLIITSCLLLMISFWKRRYFLNNPM